MLPEPEPPTVSVIAVKDLGGGLHEVALRLPDGAKWRLVIASGQTTMWTVRLSAHAVLALWGLQKRQGKQVS